MSALAFVCKSDRVEIITDSLSFDADDGTIVEVQQSKQVQVGPDAILATNGWAPPCDSFTGLVADACDSFDSVLGMMEPIWKRVTAAMLVQFPDDRYRFDPFCFFAAAIGWSSARNRGEAYMLDSFTGWSHRPPITAFALGGGPESMQDTAAFIHRFHKDPDSFAAVRDGVPLFEQMRRSLTEVGGCLCHTVGGSLHHTTISPQGITQAIIHTWPDRVGELLRVA